MFEKAHEEACKRGDKTYIDPETGFIVLTKVFLLKRGKCCNCACRHCPYKKSLKTIEEENE